LPSAADLIRDLGGPEVIRGRCRAFWRGGDGLSVSVNGEVWFDHVSGRGGGPLQLAQAVLGGIEGRLWYREQYGNDACRPKAARRVPLVPDELLRRVVASLADMRKQLAWGNDDEAELELWANIDRIAHAGGAEWRKFRERAEIADPDLYRHWVRCAIEFEADTRRLAALVVGMLAEVAA
jgi:hypothetical protein